MSRSLEQSRLTYVQLRHFVESELERYAGHCFMVYSLHGIDSDMHGEKLCCGEGALLTDHFLTDSVFNSPFADELAVSGIISSSLGRTVCFLVY